MFVRMMRDRGLNFKWSDKYATNIFARGYEDSIDATYMMVTSFEVEEHLVDVRREVDLLFGNRPALLLLGTLLHSGPEQGSDWWYFVPKAGQHVAFFSERTMVYIADLFGYTALISSWAALFIRNDALPSGWRRAMALAVLQSARWRRIVVFFASRSKRFQSKTWSDHLQLRGDAG